LGWYEEEGCADFKENKKKKTVEDVERRVVLEKDDSEEEGRDDEIKKEVRLKQTFQAKAERM